MQFNTLVSVRRFGPAILAFFYRRNSSSIQTAFDSLIFTTTHKEAKFKVFLVKFVIRIISFCWSNNLCVRKLESSGYNTLINCVASGQTFYLYNQNTIPRTSFDFSKELLHNWPGRDSFSGNNFTVDCPYTIIATLCQI